MMKKWKSRVAAMSIGVMAMTGLITAGGVVSAAPASAYTDKNCYIKKLTDWKGEATYPALLTTSCYRDYNWFEESIFGGLHKDGWT